MRCWKIFFLTFLCLSEPNSIFPIFPSLCFSPSGYQPIGAISTKMRTEVTVIKMFCFKSNFNQNESMFYPDSILFISLMRWFRPSCEILELFLAHESKGFPIRGLGSYELRGVNTFLCSFFKLTSIALNIETQYAD